MDKYFFPFYAKKRCLLLDFFSDVWYNVKRKECLITTRRDGI